MTEVDRDNWQKKIAHALRDIRAVRGGMAEPDAVSKSTLAKRITDLQTCPA